MTSFQVAQWLRQGIAAAKAGDIDRSYELLVKVVDIDEFNEQAWLWLSSVVKSDADRQVCLENVLAINPENKLAKAGLVHLRAKKAPPLPPSTETAVPSQPAATAGVAEESAAGAETDWWDQPYTSQAPAAPTATWPSAPSQTSVTAPEAESPPIALEPGRKWHAPRLSLQPIATALLFVLGLALAAGAVAIFLQSDFLDPTKREYANAMKPFLEEYDTWWQGSQGELITSLNRLCGDAADGWRNWDVILVCSMHPSQDCSFLAAHCGENIDAMRKRIENLADETQESGQALLTALNAISPPLEVAAAHDRLMACLQERVKNAEQIGELARGESLMRPDGPLVCELFSSAEADVKTYVGAP